MVWDGKAGSGDSVASCRPVYTVAATSRSARAAWPGASPSTCRPHACTRRRARSTDRGAATKLAFKVVDPYSAKADVRFAITDAKGRTVATGHPGRLATGKSLSVTWTPAARGVFTVTWSATDLAGNRAAAVRTVVTVR